jgi:hypothetical protein
MATMTATQQARQEQLERDRAELCAAGIPQELLDAFKDPGLARAAWEKQQREEEQDPDIRRQTKETARVQQEIDTRIEAGREQQRERQRAAAPIDLSQIEAVAADAEERLPALREQYERAAPEAVVNGGARDELRSIASEIRACEEAIKLVPAAKRELERRRQAREKLEKARQPHVADSRRLMSQMLEDAAQADRDLATAFESLRAADRTNTELEAALRRAGLDGMSARLKRWQLESAIQYAAQEAGMPPNAITLGSFHGPEALSLARARPLVDVTPRPIEPLEEKAKAA